MQYMLCILDVERNKYMNRTCITCRIYRKSPYMHSMPSVSTFFPTFSSFVCEKVWIIIMNRMPSTIRIRYGFGVNHDFIILLLFSILLLCVWIDNNANEIIQADWWHVVIHLIFTLLVTNFSNMRIKNEFLEFSTSFQISGLQNSFEIQMPWMC